MNKTIYTAIALLLIGIGSLVPWADAQQKPSPVIIWCQDSSGNYAPCQSGNTLDYDSGAGTFNQGMIGMALPGSGGPVAGGTSSNPIRTDPTGTTTQPVSGTVTANAGSGTFTIQSNASVNLAQFGGSSIQAASNGLNTTGTGLGTLALTGQCDDTTPQALTENSFGHVRMNCTDHALKVDHQSIAGNTISTGNGVSGTGVQRVTIASDSTGTIAATQSGNWSVRNQDGSGNNLTSATRGSERALSVQIVDGSGTQVTSFGGSGGTASNFGSAFPASGTAAGLSDGTNMQAGRAIDADSGAGTVYVQGINLLKRASGGPVEAGTSSDPLRIDPTGTTTQPTNIAQMNGVTVTMGNGASGTGVQRVTIASDSTGQVALATGSNTIGNAGVLPVTSGGTSVCYITSAASTNSTSCKASAGQLYGYDLINTTTTIYYLRIYNSSSAPTCSSSTGFVRTIPVPPAAAAGGAGGVARSLAVGEAYGTGLGFCLTGGGSSTDNTNAATGVYVSLNYK